ncbi:hypothetical protein [Solemya velesiana gill symbiont]|uniref:hypothetical protein n=1 Tax=Solemya velesiana gill symbiont TaxID=1918948 RepID=UPI001FE3986F|nr:hypothetical protein [Solemya velesiana gill symbiont]
MTTEQKALICKDCHMKLHLDVELNNASPGVYRRYCKEHNALAIATCYRGVTTILIDPVVSRDEANSHHNNIGHHHLGFCLFLIQRPPPPRRQYLIQIQQTKALPTCDFPFLYSDKRHFHANVNTVVHVQRL